MIKDLTSTILKILYAIQGTGNGHVSRAMDVVPCLAQRAEVDVLISGVQADLSLPFPVKYKLRGLSFIFGKRGGVDLWKTWKNSNVRQLWKEVRNLPIEDYDLVISDFEPVSAWACYMKRQACIGLSHQAAVIAAASPRTDDNDWKGKLILENYAPTTTSYGFHFEPYADNIFTPVIRQQIRQMNPTNKGYYTVYLPAYSDERLIKKLSQFKDVQWDVFSKHNKEATRIKNIMIQPVNNEKFIHSMAHAAGVLCGAGFETPAEALFMKKKLLVVPMKDQYEQHLNAAALAKMGVPVIKSLKKKHFPVIENWLQNGQVIPVDYPDRTQEIIDMVLKKHNHSSAITTLRPSFNTPMPFPQAGLSGI